MSYSDLTAGYSHINLKSLFTVDVSELIVQIIIIKLFTDSRVSFEAWLSGNDDIHSAELCDSQMQLYNWPENPQSHH